MPPTYYPSLSFVTRPLPVAVKHIEDMVLSFLTQLAMPGGLKGVEDSTEDSDLETTHKSRVKHKIEMRLADRRKIDTKG